MNAFAHGSPNYECEDQMQTNENEYASRQSKVSLADKVRMAIRNQMKEEYRLQQRQVVSEFKNSSK